MPIPPCAADLARKELVLHGTFSARYLLCMVLNLHGTHSAWYSLQNMVQQRFTQMAITPSDSQHGHPHASRMTTKTKSKRDKSKQKQGNVYSISFKYLLRTSKDEIHFSFLSPI